jgi:hypothetical protein
MTTRQQFIDVLDDGILTAIEKQDWQLAKKLMLEHILESKARAYELT